MISNFILDLVEDLGMLGKVGIEDILKDLEIEKNNLIEKNMSKCKNKIYKNINLTLTEIQMLIFFLENENIIDILKDLEEIRELELENMKKSYNREKIV